MCLRAKSFLRQFGNPHGVLGFLAGVYMLHYNRELNGRAVAMLDPKETDTVLELGFGPGQAILQLVEISPNSAVLGVDHSRLMARWATRRVSARFPKAKVLLNEANTQALPFKKACFSGVLAVNTYSFWPEPHACLGSIFHLLKAGGKLVMALQPRKISTAGRQALAEDLLVKLRSAGFARAEYTIEDIRPEPAIFCMALR